MDSKRDVDQQLKTSCEDFIHHVTDLFTAPLNSFMSRVRLIVMCRCPFYNPVPLKTFSDFNFFLDSTSQRQIAFVAFSSSSSSCVHLCCLCLQCCFLAEVYGFEQFLFM